MCGIAGSWSLTGRSIDPERLRAGLDSIRHRGPDDVGQFEWEDPASQARVDLGLVRLAILDLSPAGHQPMTHPSGRYTISFNGEITNYVEIRQELVSLGDTFVSDGDTEVLLKAWARWGIDTLDRLEGMYAFAVLDTHARTLTLARDPYGIKPLFYAQENGRLRFCSEMSGMLRLGDGSPRLDWQTAVDYLQWGSYDDTERSFIDGIKQLRPGHFLVLDTATGRLSEPARFWWPSVAESFDGTYADATERVRTLFRESVKRNLRSDVPVGIALSGGIDSSAIVGAVRQLEPDLPIQTFSFVSRGFVRSEHEWVARVVEATGATSHLVEPAPGDLARDIDDLIMSQGEPFGSTSIYAQYRVFKLAREHGVTVTLDGQGGDEVFAGYSGYPAHRLQSLVESGHWRTAGHFARHWADWPGRDRNSMLVEAAGRFAPRRWQGRILRRPPSPLLNIGVLRERGVETRFPLISLESSRKRRLVSQLRIAMTSVGLPSLLRHADRNSMRFSIESRVPFLDRELSELALSLPEKWLVDAEGTSKRIFRDAVRGWVPDAVIDRRDKIGFETPGQEWLEHLSSLPVDLAHPIPFLRQGRDNTVTGGLSETEIGWGGKSHWRLVNLRRWISLMGVDAS